MPTTSRFLEAIVESTRVGLPLDQVERVVRAAQVQPVPGRAGCLLGAIDIGVELVAVYETRTLLGLPSRELRAGDRFVLLRAPLRCALLVDEVIGTVEPGPVELAEEFGVQAAGLRGVSRAPSGLLLVHEPKRLLALQRAIPLHSHA